jgi:hypothetical protein
MNWSDEYKDIYSLLAAIESLRIELDEMRKERDEARRIACLQSCMGDDEPREWSPEDFAKQQGWDCFKEDA